MNKGELVDSIADKIHAKKKDITEIVGCLFETIQDTVASGDKVTIVGFGSFESRDRAERQGRNPRTGEVMEIAATSVPVFSAGKSFKEAVANHG
jgi:DNA-binding protein HU-beta